ncbi:MAG TPA: hypothetical protein LFW20_00070 [Rickettsia endosymbiont of Omalisus fontisbellaquei]|nr:hypothetical protein [Rickettsia endosymbiont of Omalisus fontisbellaquei]
MDTVVKPRYDTE